ncbi:MAG: DUF6165 family protein [Candidatus Arcticimaribacter sp.]|jgi:hypothetical protein
MKKIKVEISPADFLDRLSILNIKLKNFENPEKKAAVRKAKASLFVGNIDQFNAMNNDTYVRKQFIALQEVNKEIWELEDIVRSDSARLGDLKVYRQITDLNDKRHRIKSKIDSHLGSSMGEEKGYN